MTLKEILILKKVSRDTIAEALGINKVNINRYYDLERRSLHDLQKIAFALEISLSELIQLIYTKENVPYELREANKFISSEIQSQEYKKRGKSESKLKSRLVEDEDTAVILKKLSDAIATCVESEKIANQNIKDLLQLLKEK